MKRYGFGLFVVAGMLMLSALLGQACVLDTYGTLFDEGGADAGPDCNALCEEAAAGSSGNAGTAGQGTPDVDVPDTCDCGDAGSGGSAGAGGTGGSAGTGGATGGTGGSAGQGGATGGTGGSAGSGGEAGQGGAGGTGGSAGTGGATGGTGGTGGSPPVCTQGGDPGTVDQIVSTGVSEGRSLLHYFDTTTAYSTANPVTIDLTGKPMPGQAVLLGKDGLTFSLTLSGAPLSKPIYKVVTSSLSGLSECAGANIHSQSCLISIAKSFRCQYPPYNESVGCPAPVTFTPVPANSEYTDNSEVWDIALVDLTCP